MAIDQTSIAISICELAVGSVSSICDSLNTLEELQEQLVGANINLADFEAAIAATQDIKHCDAATYKNILADFAPQIVTAMKAFYSGTPTQQLWAAFMKAHR